MSRAIRLLCDALFAAGVGTARDPHASGEWGVAAARRAVRFRARGNRAAFDLAARQAGGRDRVVAAAGRRAMTLHSLRDARDPDRADPARAGRRLAGRRPARRGGQGTPALHRVRRRRVRDRVPRVRRPAGALRPRRGRPAPSTARRTTRSALAAGARRNVPEHDRGRPCSPPIARVPSPTLTAPARRRLRRRSEWRRCCRCRGSTRRCSTTRAARSCTGERLDVKRRAPGMHQTKWIGRGGRSA